MTIRLLLLVALTAGALMLLAALQASSVASATPSVRKATPAPKLARPHPYGARHAINPYGAR